MALRLPDKWIWDFWFARDGADYHLFYLQAPRALGDELLRHWHVTVGHAVSQDLRQWELLPDALGPTTTAPAWDDYTTWTGSIIQHEGLWYQFYTGTNRAEDGLIQRIGLATSADLLHWHKHPANPVLTADPRWYELFDPTAWHDQAWRDPWLFRLPGDERFHALITARLHTGEPSGRGVIAHAHSPDLIQWEVEAPVTPTGEFGQMEVPQLLEIDGRWYLLFCVGHREYSQARRQRSHMPLVTGTHYLVADHPLGPFRYLTDKFLIGDAAGSLYAGKAIRDPAGAWVLLNTRAWMDDGQFIGELTDPMPLTVLADSRLHVPNEHI